MHVSQRPVIGQFVVALMLALEFSLVLFISRSALLPQ
jgi:hypothetical protein